MHQAPYGDLPYLLIVLMIGPNPAMVFRHKKSVKRCQNVSWTSNFHPFGAKGWAVTCVKHISSLRLPTLPSLIEICRGSHKPLETYEGTAQSNGHSLFYASTAQFMLSEAPVACVNSRCSASWHLRPCLLWHWCKSFQSQQRLIFLECMGAIWRHFNVQVSRLLLDTRRRYAANSHANVSLTCSISVRCHLFYVV